jgi:GNAT superfamily N-acetyltransferase
MPALVPLSEPAVPRAAALSALVGWNQTVADWQVFHQHGAVRMVEDEDPRALAATAATLSYDRDLAWIAMVLVRPDLRRRGLATALMGWAVDSLRAAGTRSILLDATPAGREVYRRLGFRDLWGFARWALPQDLPREPGVVARPLLRADWPALLARDAAGFGASRAFLLHAFAARAPAFVVPDGAGGAAGVLFARDGVRGPQIGPLHASAPAVARALLAAGAAALPGAVADLRDPLLGAWVAAHGGAMQRPFTRMALGADPPGDPARMAAVAGPEFG